MDGDSTQKPTTPIQCANQCGFFGNPLTDNMCSKCYRDLHPKKGESTNNTNSSKPDEKLQNTTAQATNIQQTSTSAVANAGASAEANNNNNNEETPIKKVQTDTTKCFNCAKKIGLLGFKCRCDYVFCSTHRYSDKHECTYDYKTAGKAQLAKANPVVQGSKINKI